MDGYLHAGIWIRNYYDDSGDCQVIDSSTPSANLPLMIWSRLLRHLGVRFQFSHLMHCVPPDPNCRVLSRFSAPPSPLLPIIRLPLSPQKTRCGG